MINIADYSDALKQGEHGIWCAKTQGEVSYPELGNQDCFRVEDRSFWFQHRNRCIIQAISTFPPSGPVFDIGGGNGFVSAGIRDAGFGVVLVEPGMDGARNARSRGLTPVVCSTLEDSGFRARSLPAVGLFDVLEHIEKEHEFLQRLESLLIPGGLAYVTVPAYNMLWSKDDLLAGHYRRYSLRTLTKRLRTAGFEIEHGTYFFQPLLIPLFILRTLPSRLGLRRAHTEEQTSTEHRLPSGSLGRIMNWMLVREEKLVRRKKRIRFGTSCLVVARVRR